MLNENFKNIFLGYLTLHPKSKEFCKRDAFVSSEPFGDKVFLHPYKRSEQKADWFEARAYCASNCAEMVTLHSTEESEFFLQFIRSSVQLNDRIWLGAEIVGQTFASWSNGEPADFHKKAPSEWTNAKNQCLNIAYVIETNLWYSYNCDQATYFVACQRRADWTACE